MELWRALIVLTVLFTIVITDSDLSGNNSSNPHHHPSTGCQIIVSKDKVVSKGISSKLSVSVERYGQENISVVLKADSNSTTEMELKYGYNREFIAEITAEKLGTSSYKICVSGCGECEEVELFAIPAPLTLLPPILTVILAIVTKQVLLSLSCGVFSAAFLANAYNPVEAFMETFDSYIVLPFLDPGKAGVIVFTSIMSGLIEILEKSGGAKGFANMIFKLATTVYHAGVFTVTIAFFFFFDDFARVVVFCAMIGGLIEIIQESGGANGLVKMIAKLTHTANHAAIVTTLISFCYFFDDFAGIMISSKSLGPLVAKLGLSVQKFSFIVHMMAVSVASLCPLSSWAGIQIGYIESAFGLVNMEVSGFSYLIQSIPYRFFVVTGVFSTVIYILLNKDIVPIITYQENNLEKMALASPELESGKGEEKEGDISEEEKVPERWYNAILPLVVLVLVSLLRMYFDGKQVIVESGEDIPVTFLNCASKCNSINCLIVGTSVSLILTLGLIPAQRIMGVSKCVEHFVEGVKGMSEPIMILILAWSLGFAMNEIHTSEYIAGALGKNMPVEYFPSLVCLIGYLMSYASGSAMGTQGIIFPLVIPVVVHLTSNTEVYVKTIAAAFASTVFGNLCSPIADTTIASALFTDCPLVDHLKVMTTFCVPIAILSLLFGDLFVGMNLYPFYVSYIITMVIVVMVFVMFGRHPHRRSLFQVLLDKLRGVKRVSSGSSSDSDPSERTSLLKGTRV